MKIAVIGAGSWGTALAQLLACNGNEVGLWARKPEVVEAVNASHANPRYLSEVELSWCIVATTSYEEALAGAQAAVIVTPSSVMRDVAGVLAEAVDDDFPVIICSKGVEEGSGLLPVEVFEAEMGNASRLAVLSGPNFAAEVIRGIPSGTVIAGSNEETAAFFQQLFASETFRTYVSDDVCGVELCAAFKNVIAIAVGVSYGLGYGDNTAAMLMTRGLAEMSRLVVRLRAFAQPSFRQASGRRRHARGVRRADAHGRRRGARVQDAQDPGGLLRRGASHHRRRAQHRLGGRRPSRCGQDPHQPSAHHRVLRALARQSTPRQQGVDRGFTERASVLSHGRSAGTLVLANRKGGFDNLSERPSSRLSCEPPPLSHSLKPSTGREHAHLPPSPLCALHSLPRVPPTQGRLFYARSSASKYFDASTPSFASFTAPTHGAPAEATRPGL